MNRALPLLASNDTRATLAFYERLGFTSRGAPPEEWDYLIVESDGCELHFAGHALGQRTPGSAFVYAEDIDALHARWRDAGADVSPVSHTNFGMRMFVLHDPDGNEIRVGWPPR